MILVDVAIFLPGGLSASGLIENPPLPPTDARGHAYRASDEASRCVWCGDMRREAGREPCYGNAAWREAEAARMWCATVDLSCP